MKKIVLALGALLFACAHNEPGAQAQAEAMKGPPASLYYPLAVGNRWTYQTKLLGDCRLETVEILSHDNGFFRDNQGGELQVDPYGVRDKKRYLLRGPITEGATWTNVVSVGSVEHYTLEKVGTPCKAPAGEFKDCVQVRSTNRIDANTTLIADFTFAPKVGLVRVRTMADAHGKQIPQADLALLSYEIRPTP